MQGLRCRRNHRWSPRSGDHAHDAQQENCTCGIYAAKTLDHFRSAGYERYGIHGEVYLWGSVVGHELGYRAQFAYPKNFVLPANTLLVTLAAIEASLRGLFAYSIPIFLADANENTRLWTKYSGFDPKGLDYLTEIGKNYYLRRRRDKILKMDLTPSRN